VGDQVAGYQIFRRRGKAYLHAGREGTNCVVVGVAHEVVSEAVVALVEKKPESN